MKILVINCGSSSLKFQLMDGKTKEVAAKGLCERIGMEGSRIVYTAGSRDKIIYNYNLPDHKKAIQLTLQILTDLKDGVIRDLKEIDAVGHRVVHGGERFGNSVLINDEILKAIESCSELAPIHNPVNLEGIYACQELMQDVPMAAVFDTSFHQTMPEHAYLYGIPYEYYEKYQIRRYGFHGTSHSYVSKRAADMLGRPLEDLKLIVCHLGNGASVCAVKNGVSVDTSMGLTPLEGLIMGTRSGDLDPAVLEYLVKAEDSDLSSIMKVLNFESGVYGMSGGLSSDFRDLIDAAESGDRNGVRAMDAFVYHVVKYIGAYAAALNGADAVIFTAGLGENSAYIRKRICSQLTFLGIELDDEANQEGHPERIITVKGSKMAALAIPTNEESEIVDETCKLLNQ